MSPPYLPICGIYLPFQVNLYVPNSKPSNKHFVLYARIAHVSTRVVCIFHSRRLILKRSGLRSSLTRKRLVTGMPSPMLYANQIKITANKTPPGTLVSWRHLVVSSKPWIDACWWRGSINFTILFGNRL